MTVRLDLQYLYGRKGSRRDDQDYVIDRSFDMIQVELGDLSP